MLFCIYGLIFDLYTTAYFSVDREYLYTVMSITGLLKVILFLDFSYPQMLTLAIIVCGVTEKPLFTLVWRLYRIAFATNLFKIRITSYAEIGEFCDGQANVRVLKQMGVMFNNYYKLQWLLKVILLNIVRYRLRDFAIAWFIGVPYFNWRSACAD